MAKPVRRRWVLVVALALLVTVAWPSQILASPSDVTANGAFAPLILAYNSANYCASGTSPSGNFHFTQPSVTFAGVPFDVDTSASGSRALTISASQSCVTAPVSATGSVAVNAPATRLYLLASGEGDVPFPN